MIYVHRCRVRGFSFLELAVVFVIIGLLLLSVYGGRYLIEVSRYDEIMSQFQEIAKAVDEFEGRYGALPGDISNIAGGANDSLFSAEEIIINGNGNGIIDCNGASVVDCDSDGLIEGDDYEDLYFWYHLGLARLYAVNVDLDAAGAITAPYVAALEGQVGSVPAGPIDGSRIRVSYDMASGLVFDLSLYNSGAPTTDLAVLSPQQLSVLDTRFDDGIPNTGRVRAIDVGGCLTGNTYNTSTTDSCIVRYLYREPANTQESVGDLTCDSYFLGQPHVTSSVIDACPIGFRGNVVEFCEVGGAWTSSGEQLSLCETLQCAPSIHVGMQRARSCPEHYVGEIIEECNESGVFIVSSDNCVLDPLLEDQPCTVDLPVACPLGQVGTQNNGISVSCALDGTYDLTAVAGVCAATTCGGSFIGDMNFQACPVNYVAGDATAACSINGQFLTTQNTCVPDQGACALENDTRDLPCPAGSVGKFLQGASNPALEHRQICRNVAGEGLVWVTEYNYCTMTMCGNYPVGGYRLAPLAQQCDSGIGKAFLVCGEDGQWVYNDDNCVLL